MKENSSLYNRHENAILGNTLLKIIAIKLYTTFNKSKLKRKAFANLNQAIVWIKTIK